MTFESIITDLKQKRYFPIYFLHGEESYYIDKISEYIEKNVLNDVEKSFNQTIFYGKDTDVLTLMDAVKRYPMMSNLQVVIVKEAQDLKNFPPKESKEKSKDPLVSYIENPLKSTILVFCYKNKSPDKRTTFAKLLKDKTVFFESAPLYENQIPAWISSYLSGKSRNISPNASLLLTEYLGNDLSKISNELEKLILNVPKEKTIGVDDIEKNIGISKEYNIFELQNALGAKDVLKSNKIINYFIANPKSNPLVLTIGFLYSFFSKIFLYHHNSRLNDKELALAMSVNPFFLKDYKMAGRNFSLGKTEQIISLLLQTDIRSKGVNNQNTEDGELLKELTYSILH